MNKTEVLKRDGLGSIILVPHRQTIIRNAADAMFGARWLARRLVRREIRALRQAQHIAGIPDLIWFDKDRVARRYLDGNAMHLSKFEASTFFPNAFALLCRMHRSGVAHNDLAKEANWVCMPANQAGIVDFQLALCSRRRGKLFRVLAREDLRHLLKHKRHYAPTSLTARERAILAQPSVLAKIWQYCAKPPYLFFTRRMLGWQNRNSAIERQH